MDPMTIEVIIEFLSCISILHGRFIGTGTVTEDPPSYFPITTQVENFSQFQPL